MLGVKPDTSTVWLLFVNEFGDALVTAAWVPSPQVPIVLLETFPVVERQKVTAPPKVPV